MVRYTFSGGGSCWAWIWFLWAEVLPYCRSLPLLAPWFICLVVPSCILSLCYHEYEGSYLNPPLSSLSPPFPGSVFSSFLFCWCWWCLSPYLHVHSSVSLSLACTRTPPGIRRGYEVSLSHFSNGTGLLDGATVYKKLSFFPLLVAAHSVDSVTYSLLLEVPNPIVSSWWLQEDILLRLWPTTALTFLSVIILFQ